MLMSGILSFSFLTFLKQDVILILYCLWGIYGWLNFKWKRKNNLLKYTKVFHAIFVLFLLSMISPILLKNQDIIATLIAYRTRYLILLGIVLLKVEPSHEELINSIKIQAYMALIASIAVFVYPQLYVDADKLERFTMITNEGGTDIIALWPGSFFAILYFYVLIQKVIENNNKYDLYLLLVFMTYIFIMQNRSTMLCAIPFFIYALYKSKSKIKYPIIMIGAIFATPFVIKIGQSLIEETNSQLNNTDYNRWQAIYFFFYEQNNNLYTLLFGNGVPCLGSEYLKEIIFAQNFRKAYISDIGLLGSFFYYGLCTMTLLYSFIIKSALNYKNKYPKFIRYYCIWIIFVPTIHAFGSGTSSSIFNFCLILYMIIYYQETDYRKKYECNYHNRKLQHT